MPETFTNKLEGFLDNNTPGGYIKTNISISNNELDSKINEKINNTFSAWAKAPTKPTYTANEVGAMPSNGITISNTLNSGTKLATITINGNSTDIYGSSGGGGGISVETDPVFTNSPAANITTQDIQYWNGKSNFDGDYLNLTNLPTFAAVATSNSYNDLIDQPIITINLELYTNSILTQQENEELQALGFNSLYVLNYDNFTSAANESLKTKFIAAVNSFIYNKTILQIHSILYNFFVTSIEYEYDDNEFKYILLSLTPTLSSSNYSDNRNTNLTITQQQAEQQLSQLDAEYKNAILILENTNNTLYFKKI